MYMKYTIKENTVLALKQHKLYMQYNIITLFLFFFGKNATLNIHKTDVLPM